MPSREYWMVPGFLAIVWFGSSPTPSLPSKSSTGDTQEDWKRETTADGRWGGGRGAKSYDGEKAWSSINNSILYVQRSESPEPSTSSYLSSRESSRPNSQLSDYYLGEFMSPPTRGTGGNGNASCPATPLFARRSVSPLTSASSFASAASSSTAGWTATRRRNSTSNRKGGIFSLDHNILNCPGKAHTAKQ